MLTMNEKTCDIEKQKQTLWKVFSTENKVGFLFGITTLIALLFVLSSSVDQFESMEEKIRYALIILEILAVFIVYLQLPDTNYRGLMNIFYKLVLSSGSIYLINLIFMILLDHHSLRSLLIMLDPKLTEKIVERDYSIDCRVYTPENKDSNFANIVETFDVYISTHLFGWLLKTFIYRNNIIIWTLSAGFEFLEVSLTHWFPNFNECWWDQFIFDLFGCNLLGILIGSYILKKFEIKKFHWFFEPNEKSEKLSYFQRFRFVFTDISYYINNHHWHFLSSAQNFLTVIWLLALSCLCDLSNFFLKAVLYIPSNHFTLAIRIFIVGFLAMLYTSDLYEYTRKKIDKRISHSMVLVHLIIVSEVILFLRNCPKDFFANPTPTLIRNIWKLILFTLLSLLVYAFMNQKKSLKSK